MSQVTAADKRIRYISPPAPVSMGDDWFSVAELQHFWIRRRFEVLRRLADNLIRRSADLAEVGCGHGLLQRQIEDHYQRNLTGFDLNEFALKQTASRTSPVCCYNIFQQQAEYKGKFDIIFLFDVLEHLQDEDGFLQAVLFHLAPAGKILLNVPAFQAFWSKYDEVAGHHRRYTAGSLREVARRSGINMRGWTYWGLPLAPLLVLRKLWMLGKKREEVIASGFDAGSSAMNRLLLLASRCEAIPQRLFGSSLMAVLDTAE
jgi:SAM-dependent methyltransferase